MLFVCVLLASRSLLELRVHYVCSELRFYGGTLSEKVLGKALKAVGVPRNEYIISTKCGRYKEGFDFSAARVTKSIDESLERLQMEYVDILQCHDIEFGSLDQVFNQKVVIHHIVFLLHFYLIE